MPTIDPRSTRHHVRATSGPALVSLLLFATLAIACSESEDDFTTIGVVIPRTGALAHLGDNVEGAVILATRSVNDAGGVLDRPLRLRLVDTHSSTERGLDRMRELVETDVLALVGPRDDDLAKRGIPIIEHHGILQISGGVSSPNLSTADDGDFWFRTCPSSRAYGRALAQRMFDDGVEAVSILHVNDEYGSGFANVVASEFANLGGTIAGPHLGAPISFEPAQASYRDLLAEALSYGPDAFVLIADDVSGASFVGDAVLLGASIQWYLSPSLRSEAFLQRIPSGFLEGAVGVSPYVEKDPAFERAFRDHWYGQEPLPDAYYFFDAMILTALAADSAGHAAGGVPSRALVRDHLRMLTAGDGEEVSWRDLDDAFARVRRGEVVTYRGVTGPVTFDAFGDREGQSARYWTISNHRVEEELVVREDGSLHDPQTTP